MKTPKEVKKTVMWLSVVLVFFVLLGIKVYSNVFEQNVFLVLEEKEEIVTPSLVLRIGQEQRTIQAFKMESGEGAFYFFLPAGVQSEKIRILNYADSIVYQNENKLSQLKCIKVDRAVDTNIDYAELYLGNLDGKNSEKVELYFMQTSQVPTIFVDVDKELAQLQESKKEKAWGELMAYDVNARKLLEESLQFRGHGNGSFALNPKKSWRIKFNHAISLFGLAKGEEYVAISNAQDASYLRNKIVFDMAKEVGFFYTPQGEYANLYVNGEYIGLYLIAEKIEVSEERVALESGNLSRDYDENMLQKYETENEKGYIYPDNINIDLNTGYLLEEDTEDDGRYESAGSGFLTSDKAMFRIAFPELTAQEQVSNVKKTIDYLLAGIASEDGYCETVFGDKKHYSEIIDLDSFLKKYLIEQISKNRDGNARSSYYFIHSFDENMRIFAGPVWDYDVAFGNWGGSIEWNSPQGIEEYRPGLDSREEFRQMVTEYYAAYFVPYLEEKIENRIYEYSESIEDSVAMDQLRWHGNLQGRESLKKEVKSLLEFIKTRKQFLDDVWLEGKVYHRVNFVDGDKVIKNVYVEDGGFLEEYIPRKDGKTFVGWYDEDMENEIDYTSEINDSTAFWAKWE